MDASVIDRSQRLRGPLMRTRLTALFTVALLMMLALPAAASGHTGLVTVVHGIPGVEVDVYIDGPREGLVLEDFPPSSLTDPLELPAGSYVVEIFAAGADPDSEEPLIEGRANLAARANVSVVAHLDADGVPTLSVFANDTSTLAKGEARVTVRHTAAAPAVDILANGNAVFTSVENGQEGVADLAAGTVSAAVALAGTTDPVLGPAEVNLAEGVNTIIYAIGSAEDGTLDLLVQTIEGLHEAPEGVESGTGGIKAAEQQRAALLPWFAALAALGLAGAGLGVRRASLSRH
jgi:hypothetical protein